MSALLDRVLPWIFARLNPGTTTLLVGVNGPQGSGKTTLARAVVEAAQARGLKALSLSVDDFYLTRADQIALAAAHPSDPYLQQRGYPGTHDVRLGCRILDELRRRSGTVEVPRYDKGAHGGQGDRAGFLREKLPFDLVLFEGWMLGFAPVAQPAKGLAFVNEALRGYHAWHERLDAFIQLVPERIPDVLEWRVEAEARTRSEGKPAMSDPAIRDYIARFLPAYETYLVGLKTKTPGMGEALRIRIGNRRNPL
jgi:D-glycerate 3-kinase